MDSPRYDIYLTGKLAEGVLPEAASRQLAALFKSTPEAMAALLTGKPQLLKRGLDKAAALKYREALQGAGVLVAFKAQVPEQPAATSPQAPEPVPAQAQDRAPTPTAAAIIALTPSGGELLSPEERSRPPVAEVDTSGYELAPVGALPSAPETPAAAPATDHISLAPAGSEVLTEAERERPEMPSPDIGDLSLAEPGTHLADAAAAPPPAPDTRHISLAPADAGPLAGVRPPPPPAPNTDHLGLADA